MTEYDDGYYKVVDRQHDEETDNPFRSSNQIRMTIDYQGKEINAYTSLEDHFNGDKERAIEWMNTVKYVFIKDDDLDKVAVKI